MSAVRRVRQDRATKNKRPGASDLPPHQRDRFFTLSLDLLCIAGFDGYFKQLNPVWEKTLGFTLQELTSRPSVEFVHPDDRAATLGEAQRLMAGAETVSFENRYLTKAGAYKWLLWSAAVSVDEHLYYAVARDITERKRAEAGLRESEERVRSIVDASRDPFVGMNADGVITEWNAQAEAVFGWSRDEALGRSLAETIIPPQHRDAHRRGLKHYLATGEGRVLNTRIEVTALHRSGREIPVELMITPIQVGDGHVFFAFLHDITVRKQKDEALRLAKDEAERANTAKSEFLSRMSHELRTPLNAILGFAQVLEMEALPSGQRESVEHILNGGRHLLELINEVLDIARIEAGRLDVSLEPVSVGEVLRETLDLIAPLAATANIRLMSEGSNASARSASAAPAGPAGDGAGIDRVVLADRQRLKQVLVNLFSNAVKYNRKGGVVAFSCTEAPENRVRLRVRDTGAGIAPGKLERLFIPFERLGAEQTGTEGTGLGLALSKRLVEAMGGTLGVESSVGQGSVFWIELPPVGDPRAGRQAERSVPSPPAD